MTKTPFVTKEQLERIAERYGTPFHLYDEAGIRTNARALLDAFSWNPGFREHFAVKATPNPFVLDVLREEGCGADCASTCELMLADACGITGERVMLSSNDTPAEDFLLADRLGVAINFDDISHIPFYEGLCGHVPAIACCRFNPGGTFTYATGFMDNPGEAKYGMTEPQLREALRTLADHGARHLGVHAFLASNTRGNEYYPRLARELFELVVRVRRECGVHVSFVNLSGGIGVPYSPDDGEPADIHAIGEGVRRAYEDVLVPAGMGNVAILTELGRFMLAPYGCLVTRAIHHKHTWRDYVGVDACAADLMRPAMYGAYHHVTVMGQPGGPDKSAMPADHTYDVVGSLCENNDKFAVRRPLPRVDDGDLLVIHDTGAHGHSMGYNYNGRLRHAEVMLHPDGTTSLIRRAETPRDYFATLDCFPRYAERLDALERSLPHGNAHDAAAPTAKKDKQPKA